MERRKFTREFKLEAVRLIRDRGVSVAQASTDLGVHVSQLRSWVKKFADDPQHAFPGNGQMKPEQLEIARLNPWSQALFDNPKITQMIGDSFEAIEKFRANTFARILHDPPMFNLAGDLYSGEFCRQLFRVLRSGGRLFHYIGDLESKSGRVVSKGVVRRLQEAGFARVVRRPEAFGLVVYK